MCFQRLQHNPFETAHIIFGEIKSPKYARVCTHSVVQSCLYLDSIGEFIHLFHLVFCCVQTRCTSTGRAMYYTLGFFQSAYNITTFRSLNLHSSFIHIREFIFYLFYICVGSTLMIHAYQQISFQSYYILNVYLLSSTQWIVFLTIIFPILCM